MTQVSENVFEWTGILTQTTGEGFKLLTSKNWNPAMHPSTAGLVLNEKGSDVVALPYNGDPDTKWKISETAEYTLRVTFRETDVLVELEKAGEIGSTVPQVDGVYQISTAAQCEAFAQDVNSGLIPNNCSAVLTQDIDLSSIDAWTAIGTDGKKFIGTFDGQGHRIKGMKLDGSKKEQGFFGVAGAGATIKNLIMDASCNIVSTGGACLAAFVGCCNNNGTITFENCGNEAAVVGQKQNNAAFLGCNYGSTQLVFNNCYNTGKVSGGWENGAFSGWCGGGATFNNCYNIGEVTEGETWARGTKTINNCYQTVGSDNGVVKVTAEQVASGELCFKLNGDQTTIAWYQTIDTDTYPVPFSTNHSQVYANGEMKCDGTSVEGGTLTYSNESTSVIPPHTYQNGYCTVCGKYQENALTAVDGWFEISEPWQLRWMAQSVTDYNATYGTANIKLQADIDYTEYKSTLFGNSQATAFRGTFDGQQHTITIDVVNNGTSRTGLFAYINAATIKNLIVEGSATSAGNNCVGGLGGRSDGNGTLIENVIVKTNVSYTGSNGDATCGGFFANMENEVTLKNCAFLGSIKTGTAEGNGLLVGWAGSGSNNKYENCFVAPVEYTQNGNSADFARNNPSVTNCYRVAANDATLASGELCFKLTGSSEGWYQNLGTDATPVPFSSRSKVYELTVTDAGYATFVPTANIATLPTGVEAFAAQVAANKAYVHMESVSKVPANNAVIVKAAAGNYYYNGTDTEVALGTTNDLTYSDEATTADGTMYILAKADDKVGFYKAEGTIPARKAYIVSASGVKAFYFDGDDATGISDLNGQWSMVNGGSVYNLAGQRLGKMQKGINIVGGKKVLF